MTITNNRRTNAGEINRFKSIKSGLPKIDRKQFQKICRLKIEKFSEYGKRYDPPGGRPYFFKDNGADILAVFHADVVDHVKASHFTPADLSHDVKYFCPTLDDRAGGYAILHYLPQLGLNYDILITTGEEKLESTAKWFSPPKGKRYNWMFSFDRAGTDVVMYQYYDYDSGTLLKRNGWEYGNTESYSDICELEHLRCKGFNFGVGYHEQHTMDCYMSEREFMWNIKRFIMFYKANADKLLKHTPRYNIYLKDKGFGYFEEAYYTYRNRYQDTFTEADIELIEQLEQDDYPFPGSISKEVLDQVFKEIREAKETPQLSLFDEVIDSVEAIGKPVEQEKVIPSFVTISGGFLPNGRYKEESQVLSEKASEFSPVQELAIAQSDTKSAIIAHTMIKPSSRFKHKVHTSKVKPTEENIEEITVDQNIIERIIIVPQGRLEKNGNKTKKYTFQKVGPGGSWVWCLEGNDGKAIRVDSIVQVNG